MTTVHKEPDPRREVSVHRAVVGREATPPPPNVGESSLVEHLRPEPRTETSRSSAPRIVAVATDDLVARLATDHRVYSAVPRLADDLVTTVRPDAVVVDVHALHRGVWAGALLDHGSDLLAGLDSLVEAAASTGVRCYLVVGHDADVPDRLRDKPGVLLVGPGSALFEGVPEGAPPSRIVRALRDYAAAGPASQERARDAVGRP